MTKHSNSTGGQPNNNDFESVYPLSVQAAGPRAKRFYDTLYHKLTTGDDPMSPELAEFVIMAHWDDMYAALDPADDGAGGTSDMSGRG